MVKGETSEERKKRKLAKKRENRRQRKERRIQRGERHNNILREIKDIDVELIYYPYRTWDEPYVKYWRQNNGHLLRFINCPWALFIEDYVRLGDKIWRDLDNHIFIQWERDIFLTANRKVDRLEREKIEKGTHSIKAALRLIKLANSIQKYGYCKGVHAVDKNLINVVANYTSPHGGSGYRVLWGNHRAAVCAGLGMKKIKVRCWDSYS